MTQSVGITALLARLHQGDRQALSQLFPLVYDQLRGAARGQRRRSPRAPTLNTTALVHETFLKMVGSERMSIHDRAHFMAVAATAMRHILISHARRRAASKRGGGVPDMPFDELVNAVEVETGFGEAKAVAVLALDRALALLAELAPRQSRIVDCRFFGGMSIEETAVALEISPATVKRDWLAARAWLYRELRGEPL